MGRQPKPCGSEAAYRRHLRDGSEPCKKCKKAHAAKRRGERWMGSVTPIRLVPDPTPEQPATDVDQPDSDGHKPGSQRGDLQLARNKLVGGIEKLAEDDPSKLPNLVRELRETWRAIAALDRHAAGGDDGDDGDDDDHDNEDEFARARRLRAAGTGTDGPPDATPPDRPRQGGWKPQL